MPIIERATEADVPALCELLSILFTQEVEFQPDTAAQCKGLSAIIDHPDRGVIWVAREGQQIQAMVNLLFTVSTALGEPVALLEDMVVAPLARGTGIGSALLSHAIASARQDGFKRITLLTDQANHAAQNFYAKQGFSASTMVPMRLALA